MNFAFYFLKHPNSCRMRTKLWWIINWQRMKCHWGGIDWNFTLICYLFSSRCHFFGFKVMSFFVLLRKTILFSFNQDNYQDFHKIKKKKKSKWRCLLGFYLSEEVRKTAGRDDFEYCTRSLFKECKLLRKIGPLNDLVIPVDPFLLGTFFEYLIRFIQGYQQCLGNLFKWQFLCLFWTFGTSLYQPMHLWTRMLVAAHK